MPLLKAAQATRMTAAEDPSSYLPKLGPRQREAILYLSERAGWQRLPQGTNVGYRLYELGLCERSSSSYRLTSLGNEVADLLKV